MIQYPIIDNGREVGTVYIEKEGMTLLLRCVCLLSNECNKRRIILKSGKNILDLGVLARENKQDILVRRVSLTTIDFNDLRLEIIPGDMKILLPSIETSPVPYLYKLSSAKLMEAEGYALLDFGN